MSKHGNIMKQHVKTANPSVNEIRSATHIWQATAKQKLMDEQVALLEHRLISKQSSPAHTLVDHMIDNIDTMLQQANDDMKQNTLSTHNPFATLVQYKYDIINQAVITSGKMADNFVTIVLDQKKKLSSNHTSQSDWHASVIKAIENRRLHMIHRAAYIVKHKLTSSFIEN
ncbi:unnamed protein product [Didymodactylos carnosus]|uniref:Uncharacterized protein n=1 Tax=Didymodactylos carnosus TaxID=1234261 RepID=A0A815C2V5_9BILA|nr:unnamed protein product [Didymodactylos carnosus]CAF1279733.1 unnamed protein product [Didymodactylos carnosus]CAF3800852.1 unnamed protein product [Didymodactylos carnosus]CAF4074178.1 unnamed protein product [Didymodactylos carnosus]